MPEHVHEYEFPELAPAGVKNFAWCIGCTHTLSIADVVRRLNATERLSEEDALTLANGEFGAVILSGEAEKHVLEAIQAGRAYAAALEGA